MSLSCIKIERILYATDLSENARLAFAYAASLSGMYRSRITILNVMTESMCLVAGYIGKDQWQAIKAKHMHSAKGSNMGKRSKAAAVRDALLHFIDKARLVEGMSAFEVDDVLVESGNPVETILKISEEKRVDLIVMGCRGTGAIDGSTMGSTTLRVLKRSKISVLTIRLAHGENQCAQIDWRSCLPAI